MARQVQLRRGTTAEHSTFTGANGETTVDTDKNVVVVHDGSTVGGFPAIKAGDIGSSVLAYDANLQSFIDAFTLPTVDGTNGQFLKTDGAGALSFADVTPPSDAEITLAAGTGLTGGGVFTTDQSTNETITFNTVQDIATTATPTFAGLTMTGAVTLPADPTAALQAATKSYVDTIAAAGVHYHDPVRVEAPTALTATYDNGSSGVGATLTNSGTQAALVIDGVTLNTSDRVLVYNQVDATQNGVYTVTDTGSGSTNWVLTRATDADSYGPSDPTALGEGDAFFVSEGDTGAGELYVCTTAGAITFGTTDITFSQIAATAVYTAGNGLNLDGTQFNINTAITDKLDGIATNADNYGSWTIQVQDQDGNTATMPVTSGTQINFVVGSGLDYNRSAPPLTPPLANIFSVEHGDTSSQASVNNTGQTFIQSVTLDDYGHITGLTSATVSAFDTQTATTSSTTQTAIAAYATASYDAVKVVITADDGTDRTVTEMVITWKGTTAYSTEYATVNTGAAALATFDADVSGGNFRILATPAAATSTNFTVKAITL